MLTAFTHYDCITYCWLIEWVKIPMVGLWRQSLCRVGFFISQSTWESQQFRSSDFINIILKWKFLGIHLFDIHLPKKGSRQPDVIFASNVHIFCCSLLREGSITRMPRNEELPNIVKHEPLPRYNRLEGRLSFDQWLASVPYETQYAEFRAQGIERARCYLGDDADHHHCQLPDPVSDIGDILRYQYIVCSHLRNGRAGAFTRLDRIASAVCLIVSYMPLGLPMNLILWWPNVRLFCWQKTRSVDSHTILNTDNDPPIVDLFRSSLRLPRIFHHRERTHQCWLKWVPI